MQAKHLTAKRHTDEKQLSQAVILIIIIAVIAALTVVFNIISNGKFLDISNGFANFKVIISNMIYPTFIAWGLCFLFACGYTDMSIGGVVVLSSFAVGVFGNLYGYPGVILGGLVTGTLLVFINFNIFAFTKIPSWIASISLAMIYEAIAVFLKVGKTTKPLIEAELRRDLRLLGQLPWSLIFLAAGFIIVYFLYNRTGVGLNIRSIGGNKDVSQALGINILKTLPSVGLICGVLIGVASVLQESYSGYTTVKTGLTSMYMIFRPLAIVLLAQILQKHLNIIIAVPICAFVIYAVFNLLTILGVPSGTMQEAFLGAFLIAFGVIGQRHIKGVIK